MPSVRPARLASGQWAIAMVHVIVLLVLSHNLGRVVFLYFEIDIQSI